MSRVFLAAIIASALAAPHRASCEPTLGAHRDQGAPGGYSETLIEADEHLPANQPHGDPDSFTCKLGGERVLITSKGRIEWTQSGGAYRKTAIPRAFDEATRSDVYAVRCGLVDGDLLVLQQSTYFGPAGDFSRGSVFRLERASGKKRWSVAIPGNAGAPLRSGATLYVTAIGFVGKLDLNSGRFAWKNAELARPGGMYTYFDRPRIEGGRVVFAGKPQDPANPFPDESKVLLVDDRTGAILSGAPPPLAD